MPSRRLLAELRGATLESRLEEMGVLRSFSRPRVSNDNPYSESLFRTVKYRPDYPSRPFACKDEACEWVAAFVDWYNHRHRHSGIKFVTPHQRHSGAAKAICQQRAEVYEAARRANPTRWSRHTRCWSQPAEVWINKPTEEPNAVLALPLIKAANPMRSSLRRQLLHLATDLSALAANPYDLGHAFDLLTRSYATPVADAARDALRSDPAIAALIRERYWGPWPSQAELVALPLESLGHAYASWFAGAGSQPLPDPVLLAGSDGDDTWLHLRVRHTHDLWHVVCGCPPTAAGEAAMSAVSVMQLRWPGSAMLLGADLLHRCLEGPAAGEVDAGQAAAYGLELGRVCAPLLAQRWEEGWDRPLAKWREQLGIAELVDRSPFRAETPRG